MLEKKEAAAARALEQSHEQEEEAKDQ